MNKTINQYINQLHLDPKKEAAVRKLVESVEESPQINKLIEALTIKSKYEFVDLGLPSGIKWATCNVGANSPEEYGLYFAWGETEGYSAEDVAAGKKVFNWSTYKFGIENNLTKYNNIDSLNILELIDDAAYNTDKNTRIPTIDNYKELINNTDIYKRKINNIYGIVFTSKINNNSIFIPSAGYYSSNNLNFAQDDFYTWSTKIKEDNYNKSIYIKIDSESFNISYTYGYNRYIGLPIRPVKYPNTNILFNPADYVTKTELDETVKQLTNKSFASTILASDASNEDIINKVNELINGLISIGIIENES